MESEDWDYLIQRRKLLAEAFRAGYEDAKSETSTHLDPHAYLNDEAYRQSYQRGKEEWDSVQKNLEDRRLRRLGLKKPPRKART